MFRWRRAGPIAWMVILLIGAGCEERASKESDGGGTAQQHEEDASAEGADEDAAENRSAFGIPFPPKVETVIRRNAGVKVTTPIELDQLEQFFKMRLTDFEILRPAPNKIRIVGLYEFMPAVRGHQYGSASVLFYRDSRKEPTLSERRADDSEDISSTSPKAAERSQRHSRDPGTPVQLKTDDGDVLAPGAKWGEPYTPPPGTPLHKPRYRANWGKPLGEWQLP